MKFGEIFNLAFKSIATHRLRSFLTILGIVIGVTSVILLIAMVTGLKTYITSQIQGLGSNLVIVVPGKVGGGRGPGGIQANKLTFQDATLVKQKLGSEAEVTGVVQSVATLKFGNKQSKDASVYGVQSTYPKAVVLEMDQGRFFSNSQDIGNKKVAVIGQTVVKNLFGEGGNALNKTISVGAVKYTVIGVFAKKGSLFGLDQDNSIFIPIGQAQRQFGIDKLNTIYLAASQQEKVKDVQNKTKQALLTRLSEDDFTVQTQEQALSIIGQVTGVLTIALGGIAAISLIVGGIGIMNIMLVSVTERTREIGLRKALGAKPKDIRNQFLVEAIVLSGLGGIIGILLGYFFAFIIGQFFTTTVPLWAVGLSFGFSMLVGVVFGVAPAIRAAKLNPIQALRYE